MKKINMRVLGIDYGDSRVGIAISDALGITAQGLETIHYNLAIFSSLQVHLLELFL